MRWEFGFTCAMCLLHEGDLVSYETAHGVKGSGLMSIEHSEPRRTAPAQANVYANCLYVCRFCNTSRGVRPRVNKRGQRLLDPTVDTWAAHFVVEGDKLLPRAGDGDAEYTHGAYSFDDPRKVSLRRMRRERLERFVKALRLGPVRQRELLDAARDLEASADPGIAAKATLMRAMADEVSAAVQHAWKELQRYRAVPEDHDRACRCARPPALRMPEVLEEQIERLTAPPDVMDRG